MKKLRKYNGKIVPEIKNRNKQETLIAIYEGKHICSTVLVGCTSMFDEGVCCSECIYDCEGEDGDEGVLISMEWYIKNGYFTKEDILKAILDSKDNHGEV